MHKALVAGAILIGALGVGSAVGAVPPGLEKKGAEEGEWICDGELALIYGGNGRSAWIGDTKVLANGDPLRRRLHARGRWRAGDRTVPQGVARQERPGSSSATLSGSPRRSPVRELHRLGIRYRRRGALTPIPSRLSSRRSGPRLECRRGCRWRPQDRAEVGRFMRPVSNHSIRLECPDRAHAPTATAADPT